MPADDADPGRACHLVVVGEALLDVIADTQANDVHRGISIRAGGTASNAAIAARAPGADATIVARIGADEVGELLRRILLTAGVRLELSVEANRSTGCYVQVGSTVAADRGASSALRPSDIGGLDGDAVLVSGYVLLHDDTLEAGRSALETVAKWRAADVGAAGLAAKVGRVELLDRFADANVIFANEEEAEVLTGLPAVPAVTALARSFEVAVIKMGSSGVVAASQSGVVHVPAPDIRVTGATTGAGDALDAGVLVGLATGLDLEPALALGARAAQWALGR